DGGGGGGGASSSTSSSSRSPAREPLTRVPPPLPATVVVAPPIVVGVTGVSSAGSAPGGRSGRKAVALRQPATNPPSTNPNSGGSGGSSGSGSGGGSGGGGVSDAKAVVARPPGGIWGFPSTLENTGGRSSKPGAPSGGGDGGGGPGARSLAALAGLAADEEDVRGGGHSDKDGAGGGDGGGDSVAGEHGRLGLDRGAVAAAEAEFDQLPLLVTPTHRERAFLGNDGSAGRIGADGELWRYPSNSGTAKGRPPPAFSAPLSGASGGASAGIVPRANPS
ncbi:unnamed protein product, partial [Scytosiphon promiscuus]